MSQENVEIVRALQMPPDADLVVLLGGETLDATVVQAAVPMFHADVVGKLGIGDVGGSGINGLSTVWREWLRPWASYRTELEDVIDLGDRVLVLVRDFGRRKGMTAEVAMTAASIWTLRDGRVARVEFYPERDAALAAAGLAE